MQLIHLLTFLIFHTGYTLIKGDFNTCQTSNSCSQCISNGPNCAWCLDLYYNKTTNKVTSYYKKCDLESTHISQGCKNISNPKSSAEIIETAPLKGETRVSPKVIQINLRPGQPTDVSIRIKTPKNFPIDLYYLMDLSKSMKDDLLQVRELADVLAFELLKVSKNFRLGFGAFVDKPLGPYTYTTPAIIHNYITKFLPGSQYTFGFKNLLPLNENTSRFKETIDSVKYSFNVDGPEGSLEALMQVLVCGKAIGWRDKRKARRIVIITTDQTFHYAGDGLIGGVVIPNDATCRLSKSNDYTGWDKYDYPSLSQIRSIMIDNQIVPIFATLGNEELYAEVTKFFGTRSGAVAQRLANDSSNVVPLVKESYEKIAKIVSIQSTAPDGVEVKFSTNCGETKKTPIEADFCDNVAIGQEIEFRTTLLAKDCKLNSKGEIKFKLKTDFDDIDVTMMMICDCGCGKSTIVNSKDCNSRGNLTCGQCTCNKGFAGRFCQCTMMQAENQTLCRTPGSVGKICSGQGKCECGECSCNQVESTAEDGFVEYIYGSQCQCTNTGCRRSNGLVCGGPDRGTCDCGKCKCNEQWTGIACDKKCIKSDEACIGKDKVICGGKGTCACNKCQCKDGYIGNLCQECVANCPDPCSDYKKCVQCRVFGTSDLTKEECDIECAANNITKDYEVIDKIPEDKSRCIARDKDDCSFVFTYNKNNVTGAVKVIVQEERICPAEADILAIILGVIAGIVGIGLALLLIWKLLATIQDRREFAKFDKDRQHPKWDSGENPIYKGATSTFQNPMFDTKSKSHNPES